jgi:hypothetical protein
VLALAVIHWDDSPLRRLAGGDGDARDPTFDVALGPAPLRGLCRTKIRTYYVDAQTETPLEQGNAKAAGQLYVACSVPVQDPARADTVLRFRAGRFQVLRRTD